MKEKDYIDTQNLTRIRLARDILADVIYDPKDKQRCDERRRLILMLDRMAQRYYDAMGVSQ